MKKLLLLLLLFIISGTFYEFYQYQTMRGNLIIYLCNCSSDIDSLNIEVFINKNKVIDDILTNNEFHQYKMYVFKTNFFKKQLIEIKAKETEAQLKFKINTCLVKRVRVEFWDTIIDEKGNKDYKFIKFIHLSKFFIQ